MTFKLLPLAALAFASLSLSACVDLEDLEEAEAGIPSAAEQACLAAISRETNNGDVILLGSEFSQAATSVSVGVGPDRAPWRCNADSAGNVFGVEYVGPSEGFL
ncbi:hypothetical protein [Rubellimicrobium roseum]|uniref:Lipoprotein n=1 Tax=Rubellimicrobium roseum TaxID=687525 RepID=A0A5C4N5Y5_9RHOB|nr:hypothetical protein [Rubellimicrobium roseum]TNC65374.1 hypothetical protein FHG71_17630 [Rubellimicrobium roseum]